MGYRSSSLMVEVSRTRLSIQSVRRGDARSMSCLRCSNSGRTICSTCWGQCGTPTQCPCPGCSGQGKVLCESCFGSPHLNSEPRTTSSVESRPIAAKSPPDKSYAPHGPIRKLSEQELDDLDWPPTRFLSSKFVTTELKRAGAHNASDNDVYHITDGEIEYLRSMGNRVKGVVMKRADRHCPQCKGMNHWHVAGYASWRCTQTVQRTRHQRCLAQHVILDNA
jgi:hypothetical protein